MLFIGSNSDTQRDGDGYDEPPVEHGTTYQILKCYSCSGVTIRSYYWHDYMDDDDSVTYTTLYPSDTKMPLGLPASIEKAFRAALKVRSIDANAFGMLIGRVMDIVCQDRGAQGRFLGNKLADLATKGEIPQKLVDVSEKLTKLRNVGAHADLGELTSEEVPIVEDLCRALLDYIYTAPYLASRADETLSKLIQTKGA